MVNDLKNYFNYWAVKNASENEYTSHVVEVPHLVYIS